MISPVEERRDDQDETFCFQFVFSIISSTVPVPSGIFIPVFKIGAALGRAMGEAMALWFPNGVRYGGIITPIVPGDLSIQNSSTFSSSFFRMQSFFQEATLPSGQLHSPAP